MGGCFFCVSGYLQARNIEYKLLRYINYVGAAAIDVASCMCRCCVMHVSMLRHACVDVASCMCRCCVMHVSTLRHACVDVTSSYYDVQWRNQRSYWVIPPFARKIINFGRRKNRKTPLVKALVARQ